MLHLITAGVLASGSGSPIDSMTSNGHCNSFQAMRQNFREQKIKEGKLRELQIQEDRILEIWAKRQLRIQQQIDTTQSPLQRVRRIRNKKQEEIDRIHSNIASRETERKKTCEKRLTKRLNSGHSEIGQEASLERIDLALPQGDVELPRTSSCDLLPMIPANKQLITQSRSKSLPEIFSNPTTPPSKSRRPSLPPMDLPVKVCHKTRQTLNDHKLPPLKPNSWI